MVEEPRLSAMVPLALGIIAGKKVGRFASLARRFETFPSRSNLASLTFNALIVPHKTYRQPSRTLAKLVPIAMRLSYPFL
jgi:hypothetical protein